MANSLVFVLKFLMMFMSLGWILLWILKPTQMWTKEWKVAEKKATDSVFGYYGLDFAVYTFPVIAFAITGFIYMEMRSRERRIRRIRRRSFVSTLSNPLVINRYLGILSGVEILVVSLFVVFLVWTFYARVSSDFKKVQPMKSFASSLWNYKLSRVATRCGLLVEACLALLLFPVLRGMGMFRFFGVQFEASVKYHTWLGTAMLLFATLHGAGTFLVWGIEGLIQDEMWKWQKTGRVYLAGEVALVAGLAIWITSLPQIRRKRFEVFYYTHHLYTVFLIFFLLHTGDRHFYMVFSGVFLFVLDKVFRIVQSRPGTCILAARVLPGETMELTLPKDPSLKFTPTSIIFMKIPRISRFQWHSFSLTSSSSTDEYTFSVVIKREGWWTTSLYNMIRSQTDSESSLRKSIPVSIEGPYGPASLDFLRYDSLLLVAGGAGITPFLSILQELKAERNSREATRPSSILLIYSVKKSEDIFRLDTILPQLLKLERFRVRVKVFVTQEHHQPDMSLREVMNGLPQAERFNFSTPYSSYAAYGTERSLWMAATAALSSFVFVLCLIGLNHIFMSPPRKASPSSVTDLLLVSSFAIAILFASLMAVMLRRRRLRNGGCSSFPNKPEKTINSTLISASADIAEHEVHFGGRPDLEDLFSKFANETEASDVGVLVCGPETMKESAAVACRRIGSFHFQSLNFTL